MIHVYQFWLRELLKKTSKIETIRRAKDRNKEKGGTILLPLQFQSQSLQENYIVYQHSLISEIQYIFTPFLLSQRTMIVAKSGSIAWSAIFKPLRKNIFELNEKLNQM